MTWDRIQHWALESQMNQPRESWSSLGWEKQEKSPGSGGKMIPEIPGICLSPRAPNPSFPTQICVGNAVAGAEIPIQEFSAKFLNLSQKKLQGFSRLYPTKKNPQIWFKMEPNKLGESQFPVVDIGNISKTREVRDIPPPLPKSGSFTPKRCSPEGFMEIRDGLSPPIPKIPEFYPKFQSFPSRNGVRATGRAEPSPRAPKS